MAFASHRRHYEGRVTKSHADHGNRLRRRRRNQNQHRPGTVLPFNPVHRAPMKPSRQFICEVCDEAVSLPADLETIPRCNFCGRDSLVLVLNAPAADAPVTVEAARALFAEIRQTINATDPHEAKP